MDGPVAKGVAAMRLLRTLVVEKPLDTVFDFLSDFTTTVEWDPGTVTTVLLHGDGGIGTTYRNTTKFLGKETQLTYVVEEFADRELIRLRGENETVTSVDTMTFRVVGSGTEVSYRAEFEFKGVSRLIAPLLKPALERLGNQAEVGMRTALNRL
jgi:carbon monoxide dehydrogenase subunit G